MNRKQRNIRIKQLERQRAGCIRDIEAAADPEWAHANVSEATARETLAEWEATSGLELRALRATKEA